MLETLKNIIDSIHSVLWDGALIVLILATGIYLSFKTKFIQVRWLGTALRLSFLEGSHGEGEISSFAALCTSLAATIGTGNIVGIATAVSLGGAGSIFWMVISSFFGMATKYAEGLLGLKYREKMPDGSFLGGPFLYIEKGLGRRFLPLAKLFALFGALAGILGIGGAAQISSIAGAIENFFDPDKKGLIGGSSYTFSLLFGGILTAILASAIILGGMKRISKASEILVPFMTVVFLLCSLLIIICKFPLLDDAVLLIVRSAFSPESMGGAAAGITLRSALSYGIGRGIFSNEAGLGSAAISAAAAKENEPTREGLITMTGTFIDTIVLCTLTGLAIVMTDAHVAEGLEGAAITSLSWERGLPFGEDISAALLTSSLLFFGFTSIIGWSCYAQKCAEYLFRGNRKCLAIYKTLYVSALIAGPFFTLSAVFKIADIFNALMAVPNLIALLLLANVISKETSSHFMRNSAKESKIIKKSKKT